jgi:hypothetical protein
LDNFRVAHAGQGREASALLLPGDERAVVDPRIDARRGRRVVPGPGVEGVEEGPQQRAVVAGVVQVVGDAPARRIAGGAVLRAAEGVDADVIGNLDILGAGRVGMDERTAAVPVFGGALGKSLGSSAAVRRRMPSVCLLKGSVVSP